MERIAKWEKRNISKMRNEYMVLMLSILKCLHLQAEKSETDRPDVRLTDSQMERWRGSKPGDQTDRQGS